MKKRIGLIAASTVAIAALALTGCSGSGGSSSTSGSGGTDKTLTLASLVTPSSWAPQQAADANYVQWYQTVYDTLVRQANDGSFQPMLADSWSFGSGNTVLTMKLHPGIKFQDGTPFTADAVAVNLMATKNGSGALAAQLASIKSVTAVDDLTVKITLSAPDPALLRSLSQPSGMIASPKVVGKSSLNTTPDGTGPYQLDAGQTVSGSKYTFTKKTSYWDKTLSLPYKTIVIKPMTDITARVNALASGQVDAGYIDSKTMNQVQSQGGQVLKWPTAGFIGLFIFDRAGKIDPALGNVKVRQAINMAVDRKAMLKQYYAGLGTPTQQVFNPASNAYDASLNTTYAEDVSQAKQLMKDAGYAKGFTLEMPDTTAFFPESVVVAQSLQDIGITVKWDKVAASDTINAMLSGKYGATIMQLQSTDPWQAIQFFVAPNAAWNPMHSSNTELSALLTAAQHASGDGQAKAYNAVSSWLVDNAWFAPFYFPTSFYGHSKNVKVQASYEQGPPSIYNYAPAD